MVSTSSPSSAALPAVEHERSTTTANPWPMPVATFIAALTIVWLLLFAAYALLPFIRPGYLIIADAKFDNLVKGNMFGAQDRYRVMIFGHSRVLASTRPLELDAAMGNGFRSYNLGLPAEVRFLPILEAALSAGNVPTHVLLTLPWDAKPDRDGVLDALRDDIGIVRLLVPFRTLPRDLTLFAFENGRHLSEAIRDVDVQRQAMLDQRGWYFIKSQSHYENDRLPDDYRLPTDRPMQVEERIIPARSFVRERLEQLARKYGFQILFIPMTSRIGEYAPAPAADRTRLTTISAQPLIRVLGPDYVGFPAADFADPQHMNPQGATAYTADLARLLKSSGVFD